MNPLEIIDIYEQQEIQKIQQHNKDIPAYTVEQMIINFASLMRRAIYNGEFIFNIENMDNKVVQVSDNKFNMQRLLSKEDKEILILQMAEVFDGEINKSDLEILSDQLREAIKKSKNIDGVFLLQPNVQISLLTAKINIEKHIKEYLGFTEEDLEMMKKSIPKNTNNFTV